MVNNKIIITHNSQLVNQLKIKSLNLHHINQQHIIPSLKYNHKHYLNFNQYHNHKFKCNQALLANKINNSSFSPQVVVKIIPLLHRNS